MLTISVELSKFFLRGLEITIGSLKVVLNQLQCSLEVIFKSLNSLKVFEVVRWVLNSDEQIFEYIRIILSEY